MNDPINSMKTLILMSIFAAFVLENTHAAELFDAVCLTCGVPIIQEPALRIKTNSTEAVFTAKGMTNIYVSVSLVCTNAHTNDYLSVIETHTAWATHRPQRRLPPKPQQPPVPPALTVTNTGSVTLTIPAGHHIIVVPDKP